ncbi:MAG: asparagine synthase C-terminal domain-containing protein [Nitrospiraceae bacterium]
MMSRSGSTSIFAQWAVMRLVSESGVKVVLDGQGADELLGGYAVFRRLLRRSLRAGQWARLFREGKPIAACMAAFLRKLSGISAAFPVSARCRARRSLRRGGAEELDAAWSFPGNTVTLSRRTRKRRMRWLHCSDCCSGKGSGLCCVPDRNAMAFGVEARLPFLDHRLVEWVSRLETRWKLRDGWTKVY